MPVCPDAHNIGALILRIGFFFLGGGGGYYTTTIIRNPKNSIGNYSGPYVNGHCTTDTWGQ